MKALAYALLLLLLLAGGAWWRQHERDPGDALVLPAATGCDAARTLCSVARGPVRLALRLDPGARPLLPFGLELRVRTPQPVQSVTVDFRMAGMDMGRNRYRLQPAGPGRWRARVRLPVCLSGRSDWRAKVRVRTRARSYLGSFALRLGR